MDQVGNSAPPDEFFWSRELFPLCCCISCHEAEVANFITLGFGLTKSQEEKRCWMTSVHSFSVLLVWPRSKERTRGMVVPVRSPPRGSVERRQEQGGSWRACVACCGKLGRGEGHFTDCCLGMCWQLFLGVK